MNAFEIIDVTPDNIDKTGLVCAKNTNSDGFLAKKRWFIENFGYGLKFKIAVIDGKQAGFIEYITSEYAHRPVKAKNFLFIHCIAIYSKEFRGKNIASQLIECCENDALAMGKTGICVLTSSGVWMADKSVFLKCGFSKIDESGRFELMAKIFDESVEKPFIIDFKSKAVDYQGWHLLYSDQCPWHIKSATDIKASCEAKAIDLNITKLNTAAEAQNAPSGFGTYSLLYNGKMLEDHYISQP